jgi:Ala-tRNA(Pro) deacylase
MRGEKIRGFLDQKGFCYECINHDQAYTAQGVAHVAHISGREIAKSVILSVDGKLVMAVLPANEKINFEALKDQLKAKKAEMVSEGVFKDRFPDCEVGAMPPFGNLYGMEVVVSKDLARDEYIAFNAGSHTSLIKMKFADYMEAVSPKLLEFGV